MPCAALWNVLRQFDRPRLPRQIDQPEADISGRRGEAMHPRLDIGDHRPDFAAGQPRHIGRQMVHGKNAARQGWKSVGQFTSSSN